MALIAKLDQRSRAAARGWSDLTIRNLFIIPTIVFLIVFNIFPLVYSLGYSFTDFRASVNEPANWVGSCGGARMERYDHPQPVHHPDDRVSDRLQHISAGLFARLLVYGFSGLGERSGQLGRPSELPRFQHIGGYTCNANVLESAEFRNATPYNEAFYQSMFMVKDFWAVPEYAELLTQINNRIYPYIVGGEGTAKGALDGLAEDWEATFKKYGR